MLMPMMYKMGVMMTMLIVLTAISVKGLLVGKWKKEKNLSFRRKKENNDDDAHRKILYAYERGLAITGAMLLMLKLSTLIAKFSFGWQHNAQAPQPIHVHVHNSPPTSHNQAYSGWIPGSGSGGEHHYYYRA